MKAVRKINNNFVICIDNDGHQLIAYGKGLGFNAIPYEISDLKAIDRTYYCVDQKTLSSLDDKNEEVLEAANDILSYAKRKIKHLMTDNLYFVLADHIAFTIDRTRKGLYITNSLLEDVQNKYPQEYEVAEWALEYLNKKFNVKLLRDEIGFLAIHIVENEVDDSNSEQASIQETIYDEMATIIENQMNVKIDRDSFNFSRFKSHIDYLLLRKKNKVEITSSNSNLFEQVKNEFPKVYECTLKINNYLKKLSGDDFSNEELLYLMLHVNKLCSRENN